MSFSEHQAGENMKGDTFHHEPIPDNWRQLCVCKFVTILKLNKTSLKKYSSLSMTGSVQ